MYTHLRKAHSTLINREFERVGIIVSVIWTSECLRRFSREIIVTMHRHSVGVPPREIGKSTALTLSYSIRMSNKWIAYRGSFVTTGGIAEKIFPI